jgi:hypothetical protein
MEKPEKAELQALFEDMQTERREADKLALERDKLAVSVL